MQTCPLHAGENIPVMPKTMSLFFDDVPQINCFNVGHTETEPFKRLCRKQSNFNPNPDPTPSKTRAKKILMEPGWFLKITNFSDDNSEEESEEELSILLHEENLENEQEPADTVRAIIVPDFYFLRIDGVALLMTTNRYDQMPSEAEKI